ncbi:MAG: hypothetical protein PVG39_31755 [Desulfobacteraceae bacterium]
MTLGIPIQAYILNAGCCNISNAVTLVYGYYCLKPITENHAPQRAKRHVFYTGQDSGICDTSPSSNNRSNIPIIVPIVGYQHTVRIGDGQQPAGRVVTVLLIVGQIIYIFLFGDKMSE